MPASGLLPFAAYFPTPTLGALQIEHRCRCARPVATRAARRQRGAGGDNAESDALQEAVETHARASRVAATEARLELVQSWIADAGPDTTELIGQMPEQQLEAFWVEQGLAASRSSQLTRELLKGPAARSVSVRQMGSKVASLQRVLPDCAAVELVASEPALLSATNADMIRNVVILVAHFGGRDVSAMVAKQPRLLLDADLDARVRRVMDKLVEVHPSHDREVIADIVEEYPSLLLRMDFYMHIWLLDELPIELQNMFTLTGQGIGFLYRYYSGNLQDSRSGKWDAQPPTPPPWEVQR